MRFHPTVVLVSSSVLIAASLTAVARPAAPPRIERAFSVLGADASYGARGRVEIERRPETRRAPAQSLLRFRMQHLLRGEAYTLWADAPSDGTEVLQRFQPFEVVPLKNRTATVVLGSTTPAIPFGATLDELAGRRVQIRNAAGVPVLSGTIPAFRAK